MKHAYLQIDHADPLSGSASLFGAKNAVLVSMASLVLVHGVSVLRNVPDSADVRCMIGLLEQLGAQVDFCAQTKTLTVDATSLNSWRVSPEIMQRMRASVLVMGPLLARFGRADIALPGGCAIGARPIDYHLRAFMRMGVQVRQEDAFLQARADQLKPARITFEYPSVGATENVLLAAVAAPGVTRIINAALEPEVMDLITLLRAMGAQINILPPATIDVYGVQSFNPVDHTMMPDRLEAGALLLAAAITGGSVSIPQARAGDLDALLLKLDEMGHTISIGQYDCGVSLTATANPRAVSFKTGPFPGFPTDLQAPMMALQCIAQGESVVEETVYENRLLHVHELRKMGAQIKVEHNKAIIMGVDELYGTNVIATDIRASCALVLAGLAAQGTTIMTGIHHWRRGYDALDLKLMHLGAPITVHDNVHHVPLIHKLDEQRGVKCV